MAIRLYGAFLEEVFQVEEITRPHLPEKIALQDEFDRFSCHRKRMFLMGTFLLRHKIQKHIYLRHVI